jgi:hypothetical protein
MTDIEQKPQPHDPATAGRARRSPHPIQTVENDVEHLRELAREGESGATPAIVAGGVFMFVVPVVVIVLVLALGIAYLVTRGGGA